MIEATMSWTIQNKVLRAVSRYVLDWSEEYADHEEVTLCFYFDNEEDLASVARILRTFPSVRWGEK